MDGKFEGQLVSKGDITVTNTGKEDIFYYLDVESNVIKLNVRMQLY